MWSPFPWLDIELIDILDEFFLFLDGLSPTFTPFLAVLFVLVRIRSIVLNSLSFRCTAGRCCFSHAYYLRYRDLDCWTNRQR